MNLEDRVITKKFNIEQLKRDITRYDDSIHNSAGFSRIDRELKRDLTKKELQFLRTLLPGKYQDKELAKKWEKYNNEVYYDVSLYSKQFFKAMRLLGENGGRGLKPYWGGSYFSKGEIIEKLRERNLVDKEDRIITTPYTFKRNILSLIKNLIQNPFNFEHIPSTDHYFDADYLEHNLSKFIALPKVGIEAINLSFKKSKNRFVAYHTLPKCEYLTLLTPKYLQIVKKGVQKGISLEDMEDAVNEIKNAPNHFKKSFELIYTTVGNDLDTRIFLMDFVPKLQNERKNLSNLVLLMDGKEKSLKLKDAFPKILSHNKKYLKKYNLLENKKVVFELYEYSGFLNHIENFKKDKIAQESIKNILEIPNGSYKSILKNINSKFKEASFAYFNFLMKLKEDYFNYSLDSQEFLKTKISKATKYQTDPEYFNYLNTQIKQIETNQEIRKYLYKHKNHPKFEAILNLVSDFASSFVNISHTYQWKTSFIDYLITSDIKTQYVHLDEKKMEEISGLKINEIKKHYESLSNLPTVKDFKDGVRLLHQNELKMTPSLVIDLYYSKSRNKKVNFWLKKVQEFKQGKFDYKNSLHRELEFARFKYLVENEKVQHHIKNDYNFNDFMSIFKRNPKGEEFNEIEKWEIKCVAYESQLLFSKVMELKQKSEELGRNLLIVPNFSYGYLPFSAIRNHIEGIDTLIGSKVPSTKCHDSKEYISSKFFKSKRRKIVEKQPIILVIDGTQHLLSREGKGKSARYPDAYVGISNHVIALNDALGFDEKNNSDVKINYASFGKDEIDLRRLRNTEEFQKTLKCYKHLLKNTHNKQPYLFGGMNDLDKNLIIRTKHQKIGEMSNLKVDKINNPMILFYPVGVTNDLLPEYLKSKRPTDEDFKNSEQSHLYREFGMGHIPAYFDDSGIIINLDFSFDKYGVHYHNRLENAVQEEFNKSREHKPKNNLTYALDLQKMVKKLNLKHSYHECSV
ncbi:MAG: hypothetical protein AB7V77_01055 [Candidatus Woesearchaeota archaeon]